MSTPPESGGESSNTYFVQDRSNKEEVKRVQIQDEMMTAGMGGTLPEQYDPASFRRVLDVGCGTGHWLIEVAKTYPNLSRGIGIDINGKMVEYANAQAEAERVSGRVEFRVMDALAVLNFPADSFDLVNMRLAQSYLRKWDWANVLSEFKRVVRPGGVIRLTESISSLDMNSPALMQLGELSFQALQNAGHSFASDGVASELAHLLKQYAGISEAQTRTHVIEYRAGTSAGQHYYDDVKHLYRTLQPFMRKWLRLPDDYEQIYQRALTEIQQPDFIARWSLLTAWGTTSTKI